MEPERWQQIKNLLHSALEREPGQRAAFLNRECGEDETLRREVEALLRADDQAGSFFEMSAVRLAAEVVAERGANVDGERPSVQIGQQLGSYQITSLLGKGGMGEVYRARDRKLKREVAIKILPEEFSRDPDRVSRFQREAQVLASLNHPNIAGIYDLQEANGWRYLVLELLEGETLADRLAHGRIPLETALVIAKDICKALEAAHERGIIHRDLKPGNIKLTRGGTVKVLDFGLAKALQEEGRADPLNSLNAVSAPGVILGTAAYMSPEQAKGKPVDKRTDIFSFGCVLYEMLTGRAAFEGDHVAEIVGRVVTAEPNWDRLPTETPFAIRRLLQRALKKDPTQRLGDFRDARFEIEDALSAAPPEPRLIRNVRWAWLVAVTTALAFASTTLLYFRQQRTLEPEEVRLEITTPSTTAPLEFALSPDGRHLAFVASGGGVQRLWLRSLDKTEAQPLAGTENADYPFWSADNRSIGFTAAGELKRIDLAGGPPQTLANPVTFRGTWNAEGTILISTPGGPISRISLSGGDPVTVTKLDPPRQVQHRFPQFLPDGRHFLFYAVGTPEGSGIYLGSLDGGESKRLAAADSAAIYVPPEMIAYVRQTTLMAQHLDLKQGRLTGQPVKLADPVGLGASGFGGFSISADGRLAYRTGSGNSRQLKWYDRTGRIVGVADEPDPANVVFPELSPDGRRVALQRNLQNNMDVWLINLGRGDMTRFTFDPAIDGAPIWSPDGMRIAFLSARKGPYNLYVAPSNSAGTEELLLESPYNKSPQDWSKDGLFLLYSEAHPKTGRDLWALPMTGSDRKPIAIAKTPFEELNGQFSPDGRWVAYETNELNGFQIVVQPFPVPTRKWQVSAGGGIQPRWRGDGKELYFIAPQGELMAAPVTAAGAIFAAQTPVALFPVALIFGTGVNKQQYTVSRDGRFLISQPVEASPNTPITLVLNWKPR